LSFEKIYQEYVDKYGERSNLFEIIKKKFQIKSVLYPGSALHLTPSFYFPITVYIDTYSKAKQFFSKKGLIDFVLERKKYEDYPIIRFYPYDYKKPIPEDQNSFNLLISLYAGFISKYCKRYLKEGGILLVNNSHGDASMASIDPEYELFAVINLINLRYYLSQKNLDNYFIPKKSIAITPEYLEKWQRGIGYKKSASLYLFKKV